MSNKIIKDKAASIRYVSGGGTYRLRGWDTLSHRLGQIVPMFLFLLLLVLGSTKVWAQTVIHSLSDITDPSGSYILASDFSTTGTSKVNGTGAVIGTTTTRFRGTIDGGLVPITGTWNTPLFAFCEDATFKNIIIENVSINDQNNSAGALVSNAYGATRIYNCGVNGGSVGAGSNKNAGGLVGNLEGTSRVINCYSYANISGGNNVGGIVGYNNGTTTAGSINTMVMNCMFYGDITNGSTVSPVYGGKNIDNLNNGKTDGTSGLNNFNYYAYDKLKTKAISSGKYNCALAVEDKYLNRIEFYRLLLNSNKKLAAFYASTATTIVNPNDMAKWVLETADRTISNPKPYPVLKAQGKYPSIINIDAEHANQLILEDGMPQEVDRNKGGKIGTLTVHIGGKGSNSPSGASIIRRGAIILPRTDKDEDRFNFNYDKVQLPYYNDVGTGNYTENKVVTGWKITNITVVDGDPYTSSNYDYTKTYSSNATYFDYPNYNFADRKSSNKDLNSVSGRVFSQGAYFDVPYGVTAITIEPYWGNAAYVADEYLDVVSKMEQTSRTATAKRNDYVAQNVTQLGKQFDSQEIEINGSTQTVYTSISAALDDNHLTGAGVYDNAVVLVGNLHQIGVPSDGDKAFTMMSVDLDKDNEPDYSLIYCDNNRVAVSPLRFDFLNIPGMAQAQKPRNTGVLLNAAVFATKGWFEITNTAMMYFSQFEYETSSTSKSNAPLILLGGYIDQFVSTQKTAVNGKTIYIHVGGNVLINSFGLGTHSDGSTATPHVPVSVTGGDFKEFYLTGTYNQNATVKDDNAECYISGGRFGELAGAAQEQIGNNTTTKGNVRWQIYDADITDFFGGGINDAKPVKGNITTEIFNSHVGTFCGGPKFGNMATDKTVTTTAEGCTFDKYFGAGYGGNSFSRKKYFDNTTYNWTTLQGYYNTDKGHYFDGSTTNSRNGGTGDSQYGKKGPGVATDFDYEFFVWTNGAAGVRYYVKFASFSLAQCNNVTSNLKKCTINENFYGGGSLGKVSGTATSILEDCTVTGNVFGAGYSATLPKIKVRSSGNFGTLPVFNSSSGMFEPGVPATPTSTDFTGTEEYEWKNKDSYPADGSVGFLNDAGEYTSEGKYVVTTIDILPTNLGSVGSAVLTLKGNTAVGGNIYGGGDQSTINGTGTLGKVTVTLEGNTQVAGNVFGGGNIGSVSGSVAVNMIDGTVQKDVYGGGALADTQTSNWDAAANSGAGGWAIGKTSASATTTVRLTGGTIQGNAYGGGLGEEGKPAYVYGDVLLDLNGTTSSGETGTAIAIDSKGCVVNQVFGCNNVNGTPMGNVLVHVYATQNKNKSQIGNTDGETPVTDAKVIGSYDVKAVYGGGNLAAYKPAGGKNTTNSTNVIIDGCGLTSIQTVYGGGNAASTPATKVTVNGTFEIEELFGGGNGKDAIGKDTQGNDIPNPGANVGFYDYSAVESTYDTKEKRQQDDFVNYYVYGTGKASVNVFGGTIHRVFGGSNTKGNVRQTAVTLLDDVEGCTFCVDEAYGGGKSAPMDAEAKLLMSCIPGLNVAYGGAEAADIQGNVILNITNGKFDRVFGGNNKSGTIRGSITVNIEETGCKPIIIGELYGGGNLAGYSIYGYKEVIEDNKKVWKPRESESDEGTGPIHNYADPQINVKSFTSIGDIYGGGLGESALMVGSPTVNINVANGKFYNNDDAVVAEGTKTPGNYPIPSHAKGKIGAINNVFGGGNAAKVIGNTNVDIGTQSEVYVIKSVAVGDPVTDYFIRNFDGTYSAATGTAVEGTTYYEKKDVIGADIRGNVYGGGNNAEVTGNTNVQIGKKATE